MTVPTGFSAACDRRQVRQRIPQDKDNITEGAGQTLMVINI
jgi:hypothetical protein